jgi:hypothetical protein
MEDYIVYGEVVKFPTELTAFFPMDKVPLVTGKHIDFQQGHPESKQAKSDATPIQALV